MSEYETKGTIDVPFSVKMTGQGRIEGMGAIFGNVDRGGDRIERGAFAKSLDDISKNGKRIPMLWNHEASEVIGIWNKLTETDDGLMVAGKLTENVRRAEEAAALLNDGALSGLSIGYRVPMGGSRIDRKDGVRYLSEVELVEISVVTFPMNDMARITAIKADDFDISQIQTERQLEAALRDAGFSRKQAAFVSSGWQRPETSAQRDAGGELDGINEFIGVLKQIREDIAG